MLFDDYDSTYEIAPEGPHIGTLVRFVDRGFQEGKFEPKRQVSLQFELPAIETDGKPCLVFYTVWNLNLRSPAFKELASALMATNELRGLDMKNMIGKSCKLTIVHKDTDTQTFANIMSFKSLKAGTVILPTETEPMFFSLDPKDIPDLAALDAGVAKLSKLEQAKVIASPSYTELYNMLKHVKDSAGKPAAEIIKDELPEVFAPVPAARIEKVKIGPDDCPF